MRECALFMWAGGRTVRQIAKTCGVTPVYVRVIACAARAAGDPRAYRRASGRPSTRQAA